MSSRLIASRRNRPLRGGGIARRERPRTKRREIQRVGIAVQPLSAPTVSLEAIPGRWRSSFNAAADALAAVARSSGLPPDEIARRSHRLATERDAVAQLLDVIAREEHVQFGRSLTAPPATTSALGLPARTRACLFDLDGVLTGSAAVHAVAWRDTLDSFIRQRLEWTSHNYPAPYFDLAADYYGRIHGKPRLDGIRAFLESRGIHLPEGAADDPPGIHTVHGLANRKNEIFRRRLAREPVAVLHGVGSYLETAREAGLGRVVISPSANTRAILDRAGLAHLIQVCIDGRVAAQENLEWKPAPDAYLLACRQLGIDPQDAAAFETLPAGVAAARAAGVGFVVGVDRHGSESLRRAGADVVVTDLGELLDPSFAD
jgi:HAD superfamily hydrolase (TIGR01509 family)